MPRVQLTSTTFGVFQDTAGNARQLRTASITDLDGDPVTVYEESTGSTEVTALVTNTRGELPGWVEVGSYLGDDGEREVQFEAYSGATLASVESSTVGVLNAAGFSGVDRTGVSDSATGLGASFTAAAGGKLTLPFGTYRSLSGLVVPAAGLTLELDDAVLDFSDVAGGSTLLTAAGTLGTPVSVNAVAAGATSITGSAGIESGFATGDTIKLYSADVFDPGRTSSTGGEQGVVLSTASGVINLRSPVMGAYSTTINVAKVTRGKLTIKGTGQILGGGTGSDHIGVRAKWIDKLRISGISLQDVEQIGLYLWDCVDFEIDKVDIDGSSQSPLGYGISTINACQFGRVHHSHFRNCRHATSVNNSGTDHGGLARHITFECNEVRDTIATGDAMDCHAAAEYINWDNNTIYDSGGVGINCECPKATFTNNKIFRPTTYGILMNNCAAASGEYRAVGNEVYDAPEYGVRYAALAAGGSSTPTVLDITDNVVVRPGAAGIMADPSTGSHRLKGARINRNRVSGTTAGTLAGVYVVAADSSECCDNVVTDHLTSIPGTRLNDFSGGKWTGNITEYSGAATVGGHRGNSVVNSEVASNVCQDATGVGGIGLSLDSSSTGNRVHDNDGTGCTTAFSILGSGHTLQGNTPGSINSKETPDEVMRSSDVSSLSRLSITTTMGSTVSGTVYAARARARNGGTFTKIRFATGSTAPASLTDVRAGVWDVATDALLKSTANEVATVTAASTEYELSLASSITLVAGQEVWLGMAFFGTTPPTVQGIALTSVVADDAPTTSRTATGWAGGTLPSLTGNTGRVPWVELVP